MFNWVCPQCGKDVPPSKTECPYCAERRKRRLWQVHTRRQVNSSRSRPGISSRSSRSSRLRRAGNHRSSRARRRSLINRLPTSLRLRGRRRRHNRPRHQTPRHKIRRGNPSTSRRRPPNGRPATAAVRPAAGDCHWAPPQQRTGPPTWLMGVAFTLAFLGILAGVYFFLQRSGRTNTAEKAGLENPPIRRSRR